MKRYSFYLLCFFLFILELNVLAQIQYSSKNSKAIKHYENATLKFDVRDNNGTLKELEKALDKDPNFLEAYLLTANVYVDTKQYEKALEQYEKTFQINPDFFPNSYFTAATIETKIGKYAEAKKHYERFLKYPEINSDMKNDALRYIDNCDFAVEALKHPVPFDPKSMGPQINTSEYEYFPSITADGQKFIFTRNQKDDQSMAGYQEDFYLTKKVNGEWLNSINMGMPINTPDNEGAPSISADGQIIVFAGCNRQDGKGSCDIYYSRKIGEKWTKPLNMGAPINTKNWETQPSFSSDGKTLYFVRGAVTREGIKNQDIYVTELKSDGTWGIPVALGNKINTSEREESVFIHPDNQTLYFSSDGHPGMGGLDIFMSKKQASGEWGTPINIGYPINTSNDENSILVSPDGRLAYFASDRTGGMGGLDLYQFELYKEARPENITYVNGKVFDSRTKKLLGATFELIDLSTSKTVIESESNMGNGEFLVCLPVNKNYALNVSKNGYLFYSENFSLKNLSDVTKPFFLDVPLQPIDTGMTVELKNIFFETNKFDLREESKAELGKLIAFLNTNKNIKIEISGHTDNVGDKKSNLLLSQNRAKSVYDYLITNSIDLNRLSYKGYGDTLPKQANDTEENRAKNRRTEFKVISK